MKLAGIWNCWDADYLLPYSIGSIYKHVDVVIVVYQNMSNYGHLYSPEIPSEIVDHAIHFTPDLRASGTENEKKKRNIGLNYARELGCTHFIMMDNDEMYDSREFGLFKAISSEYDSSACRLYTYYHSPDIRLSPIEDYFVPFISKIYPDTRVGVHGFPVLVDPTRSVSTHKQFYQIEKPLMHHYSWVRRDIEMKLRNSSARKAFDGRMDDLINGFNDFPNSKKIVFYTNYSYCKTENKFGIEI